MQKKPGMKSKGSCPACGKSLAKHSTAKERENRDLKEELRVMKWRFGVLRDFARDRGEDYLELLRAAHEEEAD